MQHSETSVSYYFPVKTITIPVLIFSVVVVMASAFKNEHNFTNNSAQPAGFNKDSIESVQAFKEVYKVLMSPRCMNCHPAGDVPLQGDDNHLHVMSPQRGKDGKGLYAMKCSNCHQATNTPGLHTPPGDPNWHLPPADMKMVFQGKTAHQLAKQIMNPALNGHKNKAQLLEHAHDELVLTAWNPGEGRTLPPMSHEAFAKAWATWINKGGYAPASK
jgi:hypothetical protein